MCSYGGRLQPRLKNGLHKITIWILIIKMACTVFSMLGFLSMAVFSWASAFTVPYIFACFFEPISSPFGFFLLAYMGAYLLCYLGCLGCALFRRNLYRVADILLGVLCISDVICFSISFWDLFHAAGFELIQISKLTPRRPSALIIPTNQKTAPTGPAVKCSEPDGGFRYPSSMDRTCAKEFTSI